jgi:hypothetical protein
MKFKKRLSIQGFLDDQYVFSKHVHQDMQHTTKLNHKKGQFPENEAYSLPQNSCMMWTLFDA